MLKKLLASALAVATVASCAYVPSALASAATTYVTANMADYLEWSLKNPAANTNVDVTVYVSGSGVRTPGSYTMSVKPENNTVEYVQANFGGAKFNNDTYNNQNTPLTPSYEMHKAVRYVVKYAGEAGANNYVVNVAKERAVVYHPFDMWNTTAFANVAYTDADTLNPLGLKLLGYYEGNPENAVLTELTQAKYIDAAKVAGYKFKYWEFVAAADAATTVSYATPKYVEITADDAGKEYTKVDLVQYNTAHSPVNCYNSDAAKKIPDTLKNGLYIDAATWVNNVYMANSESATWTLALNNRMKVDYANNWISKVVVENSATVGDTTDYYPVAVRQIAKATTNPDVNAKYAIVYGTADAGNTKYVDYTLQYKVVDTDTADQTGTPVVIGNINQKEWGNAGSEYYTTDPEEIYNKLRRNTDKATLADYLAAATGTSTAKYVWNGAYSEIKRDAANTSVTVIINVVRYNKYTVYSFGPDNSVAETTAFLSKDDVSYVSYTSKDLNDKFAPASVIKASAEKLGASETATIKDVPATYAYSDVVANYGYNANADLCAAGMIYSTYKMGDATVEAADFATATGAFDAEAYFGRAAKAGDVVTLKVSFSDQGDAKKFELKNVTVKYDVIGATKGETFEYATKYTNDYKNGVATEFVLAEGANIITGTVTYNGKTVTLAPFYAYVG